MRYSTVIGLAAAVFFGCGGPEPAPVEAPPRPPRVAPQTQKIAGDPLPVLAVATMPVPDRVPEPRSEPEPEPEPPEVVRQVTPPEETNPLILPLPFADRLPAPQVPDPRRYARWRQRVKIHVGQSHLDTADISADGRLLLARSDMEATVRIYDRRTRKLRGNFAVPGWAPGEFKGGDVTFWPDPEDPAMFLVGNSEGLALFDTSSGDLVARLGEQPLRRLRWSADRRILVGLTAGRNSRLVFLERGVRRSLTPIATMSLQHRVDGLD